MYSFPLLTNKNWYRRKRKLKTPEPLHKTKERNPSNIYNPLAANAFFNVC